MAVGAADSFALSGDIKAPMEEFCECAGQAVTIVIAFLVVVGTFHVLAVSACLVIWALEKFRKDRE
jgi:hypothetical protein